MDVTNAIEAIQDKLLGIEGAAYDTRVMLGRLVDEVQSESRELKTDPTPWMDIARGERGVKEISGRDHNARILEYHGTTGMGTWGASRDETAWCSSFVNWCMVKAGIEGTNSAMARSWLKWGREIDRPVPGCVVVLRRGAGNSGHVGFYDSSDATHITLLGGNQSDEVCLKDYRSSDVLGYRMPTV